MKRLLPVAALGIALVVVTSAPGLASFWVGYVTQSASGGVTINLFTWYALPMDLLFRSIHEVEALDLVRRDLVRRQQIRDLPILIWGPARNRPRSRIANEPDCVASYGERSGPDNYAAGRPLGRCYDVEIADQDVTFQDQLALTTALSELSAGIRRIEVADLPVFQSARSDRLKPYRDLVLQFDPIWSPDSTRLLYTVWSNGAVGFELTDPSSGAVTRLERLDGYMATRPIWSADSRFVAYAALDMVKVYDRKTRTTRTFRPTRTGGGIETRIQFDGGRLRFAFDVNALGGWEAYTYDGTLREPEPLASETGRAIGEEGLDLDRHASLRAVRSPNGRWIAFFTFVQEQRRVAVRALR